ncbi:hypothetical protein [Methylobacterium nodulans]|uniref:Uncharacterized protein n=1 Tax=Methylobacterium nodulans (strain LMG 21967 / CNCM I-2342 / ORS 2060) TaxID=460265 RepID=B8IX91_METNO|nr:hypothetical protein Mnod_8153 [Methylobacterium nodulans ORS 2060]
MGTRVHHPDPLPSPGKCATYFVGLPDTPTIGELLKLKRITSEQINAAAAAYIADPAPGVREIAKRVKPDIAAAVEAHPYAQKALAQPEATVRERKSVVKRAILLARPARVSRPTHRSGVAGQRSSRRYGTRDAPHEKSPPRQNRAD